MEENKKVEEPQMVTKAEMDAAVQEVIQQAQKQLSQVAQQAQQLSDMLRDKTIEQLFKVLEFSHQFNTDFVIKCSETIEKFLGGMIQENPSENKEDKPVE